MKKVIVTTISFLCLFAATAQTFPGYRAGNYTGVNGVFFNPANIADSRYRFDFNLISVNGLVNNDKASFNFEKLTESLNGDSLKNLLFGESPSTTGNVNVDIFGPSLMFNLGKKTSLAFTTRLRAIANISNLDGKYITKVSNDPMPDPTLPYTTNNNMPMKLTINGWAELGVSWGQVLVSEGKHFFKVGASGKYLAGGAAASLGFENFKSTVSYDGAILDNYVTNTTGRVNMAFGGVNVNNLGVSDLTKFKGQGVGFDFGFVYEFRPHPEKFTLANGQADRERNKYAFKLGVALTDIGSMQYDLDTARSGDYNVNIAGNNRFYLDQVGDAGLDGYKTLFRKYPQYFNSVQSANGNKLKIGMPTTLQVDADLHLHKGFYIAGAAQVALTSKDDANTLTNYNSFSLTPRFEGRRIGLYVPLSNNDITGFNAGASIRLGPLFIGSGSIITALFSNSKQADLHFGLRFGSLYSKTKKKKSTEETAD